MGAEGSGRHLPAMFSGSSKTPTTMIATTRYKVRWFNSIFSTITLHRNSKSYNSAKRLMLESKQKILHFGE